MERLASEFIVKSNVLWSVFGIALIVFVVMSMVFVYHWQYYGVKGNHRVFAKGLYFVGGIFLLVLMFYAIGGYTYTP